MWPPSGYAATVDADKPFTAEPFMNTPLFGGVYLFAVKSVPWAGPSIPDLMKTALERSARVRVADVSPIPPTPQSAPTDGWVESLGDGGNVSVGMTTDATGTEQWYVRVQSSLSHVTLESFYLVLLDMQHRLKLSFKKVWASGVFQNMEALAEFNARRIAWAFADGADIVLAGPLAACNPYHAGDADFFGEDGGGGGGDADDDDAEETSSATKVEKVLRWLGSVWGGSTIPPPTTTPTVLKIPTWYVVPFVPFGPKGPKGTKGSRGTRKMRLGEMMGSAALQNAYHHAPKLVTPWGVMRSSADGSTVTFYCHCSPPATHIVPATDPAAHAYQIIRMHPCLNTISTEAIGSVAKVFDIDGESTKARPTRTTALRLRHFWLKQQRENVNLAVSYGELDLGGTADAPKFVTTFWARHSMFGPGAGPSPASRALVLPPPPLVRLRSVLLLGPVETGEDGDGGGDGGGDDAEGEGSDDETEAEAGTGKKRVQRTTQRSTQKEEEI